MRRVQHISLDSSGLCACAVSHAGAVHLEYMKINGLVPTKLSVY